MIRCTDRVAHFAVIIGDVVDFGPMTRDKSLCFKYMFPSRKISGS